MNRGPRADVDTGVSHLQIAPLIVVTTIFWLSTKPVFKKPMSSLSLRTAVDLDYNDRLVVNPSAVPHMT